MEEDSRGAPDSTTTSFTCPLVVDMSVRAPPGGSLYTKKRYAPCEAQVASGEPP